MSKKYNFITTTSSPEPVIMSLCLHKPSGRSLSSCSCVWFCRYSLISVFQVWTVCRFTFVPVCFLQRSSDPSGLEQRKSSAKISEVSSLYKPNTLLYVCVALQNNLGTRCWTQSSAVFLSSLQCSPPFWFNPSLHGWLSLTLKKAFIYIVCSN